MALAARNDAMVCPTRDEKSIFLEAIEIDSAEQRLAFVYAACADNPPLRAGVEALLRAHQKPRPVFNVADASPPPAMDGPGTVIGLYTLIEPIGEGGFGVVYLAEQHAPVRRNVALKVLKPGMGTRQVVARFEAERQALALMDHPNIAKVFDGGATPSGRPYFVMELVQGLPITEFCDRNHSTPRQRLDLFMHVCNAVQHAHQKGIIHRDLKPSNVLVVPHDATAVPKVIDFGIAKAMSQELTDKTLCTGFAEMIGTPTYMSPEQAGQIGVDIDTRSDIYSLGVLLYELLTGTTPFPKERFRQAPHDEIRRVIREEDPPKPSKRLSESKETLPSISAQRQTEPAKLTRLVRGELDWIVMKALEKDRTRRYETANGMAMDVQRYLADEPVLAGPPTARYRFRKFARRNKGTLVTAGLVGPMLLGLVGSIGWIARDRATRHGRDAEAVAALLEQCEEALRSDRADRAAVALGAAERRAADGGAEELAGRLARCRADLVLLSHLDAADTFRWTWADGAFPGPGAVAARWRAALADYGVTPDEGRAAEVAATVTRSLVRDRVLTALDHWLSSRESEWARPGLRAVLRSADPDPYRDAVRDALAVVDTRTLVALAGRPEALDQPARFAVVFGHHGAVPADRRRAVLASALRRRPGNLWLLMALGTSYPGDGLETAGERVRWYQAALAAQPGNLAALNNLGTALRDRRDLDGAVAALTEAVRLDAKFAFANYNLGLSLRDKRDVDGAIAAYKAAIQANPKYTSAHFNLGNALRDKGDLDGAIAAFKEAVGTNSEYANAHVNLASALRDKGDTDGALASFREAIRLDPKNAYAHTGVGSILRRVKRDPDGAIAAFKEAIRLDPEYADAHHHLGVALRDKGDPDGAIAAYKEAIRLDPKNAPGQYSLGKILWEVKRDYDGAMTAFQEAIRLDPNHADAHTGLGVALLGKRNLPAAIASFKEALRLDPNADPVLNNLAWLLAAGPDAVRDGKQAVELATRACERTGWKNPNCFATLGVAYAEAGDFDQAVEYTKKALSFPEYEKRFGTVARRRLDLFARKLPYRDPDLAPRGVGPPP